MQRKTLISRITFAIIVVAQLIYLLYCGTIKAQGGMHIDEIYSYILSNSYDGDQLVNMPEYFDRWIEPSSLLDTVTVQPGEQFAYQKVYYNNTLDSHPPLYYFLLHSICSFFPNQFSIWFGIGLNLIFFILSNILLYILGLQVLKDEMAALIPPIIWGFSRVCLDSAVFVRMYMVLTFFVLSLVVLNYHLIKKPLSVRSALLLFIVSFLGAFTHYYFLIFNFFLTLGTCLYKLYKKDYKNMLLYGSIVLAAVLLLFISYPAVISQAFGSSTNNVGVQVAKQLGDFSHLAQRLVATLYWVATQLFSKYVSVGLALACCLLFGMLAWQRRFTKSTTPNNSLHSVIALSDFVFYAVVLAATTITTAHVSGIFYTTRYVFDLMPLYALLLTLLMSYLFKSTHLAHWGIPALLVLSILNAATFIPQHQSSYYFADQPKLQQTITSFPKSDCLVLNASSQQDNLTGYSNPIPTNNVFTFQLFHHVYLTSYTSVEDLDAALAHSDSTDSTMVYLATDTSWIDGYNADKVLKEILDNSAYVKSLQKVAKVPFGILYYVGT